MPARGGLAKRRGLDITLLKDIVSKIANGEILDTKYKDHPLSGNWSGHRECHIQPFSSSPRKNKIM